MSAAAFGHPTRLHPADIEAIAELAAQRSAQLVLAALHDGNPMNGGDPMEVGAAGLVDATAIARQLRVDRSWVYAHADELGAVRLGDGPRPRLRFDPAKATAAMTARQTSERSPRPAERAAASLPGRRRRRAPGSGAQLLPIRGS